MTLPTRVVQAIRPQASTGVIAGAAVVAATFAATPFLIPEISESMSISIGTTGLISTAQVGTFALASFLAGRLFKPGRRLHNASLVVTALATLISALVGNFPLLLASRALAGLGLGALTAIAWADATRFSRGIGEVAAVAPVTAAIASPAIGWLTEAGGYRWVYGALALIAVGALALKVDVGDLPRVGKNVSGSHSNRFLLAALLLMTLGGSSVFIFTGATATDFHGLTPVALSWALSLNAITGVIATRAQVRWRSAWPWIVGTALSALAVGTLASAPLFFVTLAFWGYAFWMAVPQIMKLLADRSNTPGERMGDAQAFMAVGRIAGPVVGGAALAAGGFATLSITGASIILAGATVVAAVEIHRSRS